MKEALKLAEKYGDDNQYLGNAIFRADVNYLAHGILHPEFYDHEEATQIKKVIEKTLNAYQAQRTRPPLLDYQKAKLEILWSLFSKKVLRKPDPVSVDAILKANQPLQSSLPKMWDELTQLSAIN
jgi:hypothetical protein